MHYPWTIITHNKPKQTNKQTNKKPMKNPLPLNRPPPQKKPQKTTTTNKPTTTTTTTATKEKVTIPSDLNSPEVRQSQRLQHDPLFCAPSKPACCNASSQGREGRESWLARQRDGTEELEHGVINVNTPLAVQTFS